MLMWALLLVGIIVVLSLMYISQQLADILRALQSLDSYQRWKDAGGEIRRFGT